MSEAGRPLEIRERFRLLTELIDAERKMIEVADHKARFALVIAGAVNAALLLFATRGRVIEALPDALRPWLLALLVPYGMVTFAFLLQAADVLRPHMQGWARVREKARLLGHDAPTPGERPLGLFYWDAILESDIPTYNALWTEARVGQVSAELVLLAHGLARVNSEQYAALRRLFLGLKATLALAAVLLAVLTFFALR